MPIRILMADDHQILREGLRALLNQVPDFEVVGEAGDGRSAVQAAFDTNPDVVIMDISMPDLNGIEATRQILERLPRTKIIVLSMHSDRRFVAEVLKAGAAGYLLKDCAYEELVTATRTVMTNRRYLSPQIQDVVLKDYTRKLKESEVSAFTVLTEREREVLQMVAEGKTTKEIAAALAVSSKTVDTYRQRIMDKLNIRSVADLTKYAVREGLTTIE